MLKTPPAAQDASNVIYLPKMGETPAKVIYLDSMTEAPVIAGEGAGPPHHCPDHAFWTKNDVALVSCGDGVEYNFVTLDKPNKIPEFKNALGLKVVSKPDPGTDDPGPMRNDSKKEQKP